MEKLKNFIKALFSLFCVAFTICFIVLTLQGKNATEEIFSWFENDEPTIDSVMQENSMTREEAFDFLMTPLTPMNCRAFPRN